MASRICRKPLHKSGRGYRLSRAENIGGSTLVALYPIQPEDVARLSPLVFEHINLLGRYAFSVPEVVSSGQKDELLGEIGSRSHAAGSIHARIFS
jgi:hypothetical protein